MTKNCGSVRESYELFFPGKALKCSRLFLCGGRDKTNPNPKDKVSKVTDAGATPRLIDEGSFRLTSHANPVVYCACCFAVGFAWQDAVRSTSDWLYCSS